MSIKSEDREEKTPNVLKARFIYLTSLYSCFKDLIQSRYFSFFARYVSLEICFKANSKLKNVQTFVLEKITVDQALGCPLLSPKGIKSQEDQHIARKINNAFS